MISSVRPKDIKGFIIGNKWQFLISLFVIVVGVILGVVVAVNSSDTLTIFATSTVSLSELITGDYSAFSLFFGCFTKLLLACVILFVLSLTRLTSTLNYVYLAYQGMLVSMTATNLIYIDGIAGALNVIVFTIPVNLINLFLIAYASALFIKRREYQKKLNKTFGGSFDIYSKQFIGLLIGIILSCFIYGVIYPILLRSIVIVNC